VKIYVDGLFYKGSGIGRYYENLLKELLERDYIIYSCIDYNLKDEFSTDFGKYSNVIPIFVKFKSFSIKNFLFQSKILYDLRNEVDLFFFPHINIPIFIPAKTMLTVHDVRVYSEFWDRSYFKKKIFEFFLKHSIKKSKKIVVISNNCRSNLIQNVDFDTSKIKVIYNFIEDKFFDYHNSCSIIKEDYILYVGNRKKHKNLENLIIAYNAIKDKINCKLVIAGAREKKNDFIDNIIQQLKLDAYIIQYIFPKDEILMDLYSNAKLFVFPTFYEGFGYPPLEAIALNTPVITSNIEVLKEILGDEIACFNPNSSDELMKCLYDVMINNKKREFLLKIGKKRLQEYKQDNIMKQYVELFKKVANK